MCLRLKSKKTKVCIAKEDIICYKFLIRSVYDDNGVYRTPYKNFPITIGSEYTSELNKDEFLVDMGLHTFKNLEDTRKRASLNTYYTICKCLIPKGSRYYKGTFNTFDNHWNDVWFESYASDRLIYLEIIK